MIDLYCERTAAGLWGEPLNTLTNLAFFIAAWTAWRLARQRSSINASAVLLVGLIFCTGIGSTLFHMFATAWSEWLDDIPIMMFQISFLALYLRRVAGMRPLPLAGILLAFLAADVVAGRFPQLLNGSVAYLPTLLFLTGLGLFHYRTGKESPWLLLAAAGSFFISLGFRIVDNAVCGLLPMGTHLFWHLLNGVVLYLLLRAYIFNVRDARPT